MKAYTIKLEEDVAKFFEEIAVITKRPVEEILSGALRKQIEIIGRRTIKEE